MHELIQMDTNKIIIRDGWNIRSSIDHEELRTLRTSIEEIGLIHPITINPRNEIVSGFRRFQVILGLKWKTIPCHVVDFESEYHEELINIDENLCRKDLSGKDLDKALSKRKKIYAILYPHTIEKRKKKEHETEKSFSDDTAEKTGLNPSTINTLIARVDKVTDEVRESYEADRITASQVDELTKVPREDQNKILKKIQGASVAETKLIISDFLDKENDLPKTKLIDKDEKLVNSIFEAEKIIKATTHLDVLIESFYHQKKHKYLNEEYEKRLKQTLGILLSTVKRRISNDFCGMASRSDDKTIYIEE